MENKTADPSVEAMAPELDRAEAPVEATHLPPPASTAGMSAMESLPPKEPPETAPAIDRQITEGPMVNLDNRPPNEASAQKPHGREMASPEGSIPHDCTMAMEDNPVTTAGVGVLEARDNAADQETLKPSTKPESSATDWMVPTSAATRSKISFDGS